MSYLFNVCLLNYKTMKKQNLKTAAIALVLLMTATQSFAIPPLGQFLKQAFGRWDCMWVGEAICVPDQTCVDALGPGAQLCTQSQYCTNWLWGNKTNTPSPWCSLSSGGGHLSNRPECPECQSEATNIANAMYALQQEGFQGISSDWTNATSLQNESIRKQATVYRLRLAGYDADTTWFDNDDDCFVAQRTLTVQKAPAYYFFDVTCVVISPNPAQNTLNVNFNNMQYDVTKIEVFPSGNATPSITITSNITNSTNIDVSNLANGNYFVKITTTNSGTSNINFIKN